MGISCVLDRCVSSYFCGQKGRCFEASKSGKTVSAATEVSLRDGSAKGPSLGVVAVRLALPLLREQLAGIIESETPIRFEGGVPVPIPGTFPGRYKAWVQPLIDAVQACEAAVGRAEGIGPEWLNEILDGGRAL